MKIFNLMFGKKKGGLEKASLDYALALSFLGHDVTTFLNAKSAMIPAFKHHDQKINATIHNLFGSKDPLTRRAIQRYIQKHQPDICITHGRRAAYFAQNNSICPTIAVSHSFNIKSLQETDGLIAINNAMKQHALDQGYPSGRIQIAENFLPINILPAYQQRTPSHPIRIGAMARLIHRKGIDVFIQALHATKQHGIDFKAIIAGTGEELEALKKLSADLGLADQVEFKGWMASDDFYKFIDIFCMPSRTEPFGLVILEAWAHGLPVVATNAAGPAELITDRSNGVLVPIDDPKVLAESLVNLAKEPDLQNTLSRQGYDTASKNYLLPAGAKRIEKAIIALFARLG
ncbi:MAG: hypothetical protein CMM87_05955 [Rickettsiales bacterium]|nr:hypothetical protein [Rickettsiales bacterium]|tara:strand:- start:15607 stop:16644 length:1038 start_codon:yes stop_codon:yes gene_type:complete